MNSVLSYFSATLLRSLPVSSLRYGISTALQGMPRKSESRVEFESRMEQTAARIFILFQHSALADVVCKV